MNHKYGNLQSAGGIQLYFQSWHPESNPIAIIAFVHGAGGHSGQATFAYVIDHLVRRSYALYGIDLRGYGRSQGRRCSIDSWNEYRSDLQHLVAHIRKSEPALPIFLLGQSLGGLLAIDYALCYPADFQGVIASAPALSTPPISFLLYAVLLLFSRLTPHRLLSPIDLSGVSRDSSEVQKLLDDPLTNPSLSFRLMAEMLKTIRRVQSQAAAYDTPLLLLHGDADPIVPVSGSRDFVGRIAATDKTFKCYQGGYHQPFIDKDRHQVLDDISEWLHCQV